LNDLVFQIANEDLIHGFLLSTNAVLPHAQSSK
jgi:hypothetical protein